MEEYRKTKLLTKHAGNLAKFEAEQKVILKDPSPSISDLFHFANQMSRRSLPPPLVMKGPSRSEDVIFRKIPTEWEGSIIVTLYKGMSIALARGNSRVLKLLDQVIKVLEGDRELPVTTSADRCHINLASCLVVTPPTPYSLYASFKKSSIHIRDTVMAFVDLEKIFDRVPRHVIWWAIRKLGVEEWLVCLILGWLQPVWRFQCEWK